MPTDLKKLIQDKDLIISTIRSRGPSLPVHIARAANINMLFASAYLSELFTENRVKMSEMRVGSSPLYYLQGQESMLENFIEHLAPKEREALLFLKNEKVAEDEKLLPAIRVALRGLRDFAVPIKVKYQEQTKLIWKHYLVPDEEIPSLLHKLFEGGDSRGEPAVPKASEEANIAGQEVKVATTIELPSEPKAPQHVQQSPVESSPLVTGKVQKTLKIAPKKERKAKSEDLAFANKIKEHLESKDFEVLEIILAKKKECMAKVRIDMPLGKQEYLMITKDKKKVTEDDLAVAIHKAQHEKMPALLLTSGVLDAEAQEYSKIWRNLIKVEKFKF